MTKLIFACDVSCLGLGYHLIDHVASEVDMVKVGLEAMTTEDDRGRSHASLLRERARARGKDVFWDMKLNDITNTVGNAARNIVELGSAMFTLHATVSDKALAAVAKAAEGKAMALAVTVLTDFDSDQCMSRFGCTHITAVVDFARMAYREGIRGLVCSAQEARYIRDTLPDVYIVTPGIRPEWATSKDEQHRITTPTEAKKAGVDAIVVGRPIYNPPLTYSHRDAAQMIREELAAA